MPSNSTSEIVFAPRSYGSTNPYSLGVILFITVAVLLWVWFREAPNAREPPTLHSKFPLIGHLLGIIQYEADYFKKLR